MIANNQVVVVTGGGRGIGRAICQRFALDGVQVVAASRSLRELEETHQLCEEAIRSATVKERTSPQESPATGRCHVQVTDVCVPDEVEALVDSTVKRFGRLDVLVNCAGVAPTAPLEDLEPQVFRTILAVNVEAMYYACRKVWGVMKKQGGGVIVNISSIASVDAFPGFAAYGASKAWVNAWTKALAEEGRAHKIRVFAVAPGAVETKMLRDVFPTFPNADTLRPSDVADVVHALAQSACRYATGATVFVRRQGD
jgi:NAD(P)-dependent dehydrogenase (short-subunit alcohol dehydrogenase family)